MPTPEPPPAPARPLFLELLEPVGDTTVESPLLEVSGLTISEAVVSVDGDLARVESDGRFALQVPLVLGANLLEVVASDPLGNQISLLLSVIYEP